MKNGTVIVFLAAIGTFYSQISDVLLHYGGRSSVGRASGCGPECRGFEPHRSPQSINIVMKMLYLDTFQIDIVIRPTDNLYYD
jgi:hypothetical protein